MRHKNILVFSLLLLLHSLSLVSRTNSQPFFSISATISTNKIPLNKNFKVTLEIKVKGDMQNYIISSPFIDKMHNMEIIGTASENTTIPSAMSNQIVSIKKYIYTLKPSSIGMAYFPKVLVSVSDKKGNLVSQLDAPAIPIEVLEPLQKKSYKILYVIISIIIILALAGLIFFKYKKFILQRKETEEVVVEISIEDKYLDVIEKEKNIDRLNKDKIDAFTKLLKSYLEEKYKLKIKNKSLNEISNIFEGTEIKDKDKILNILKDVDLIKYALEEPDAKKTEEIINSIIEIIKTGGNNNE